MTRRPMKMDLATRLRRRQRRHATVRAKATYLGDSKFRFDLPCGHYRTETQMVPKPGGGKQPMNEAACRLFGRYWAYGVNVRPCRTCERKGS